MSDTPESSTSSGSGEGTPGGAGGAGDVPVARPAGGGGSGGSAGGGPRPIFDVEEDRCPKCGALMNTTDVVCMKCGYDMRANTVREVETGTVEVPEAEPASDAREVFVQPSEKLTPKVLGIAGGVITVLALVATGVWAPAGAGALVVIGMIVLTLYQIALHTATGVVAVGIAARLEGAKFGRGDFAIGRMFVAFALFSLLIQVQLPMARVLSVILMWAAAIGVYFLALMILFKKDKGSVSLIALAHFGLWMLLQAGMALSSLVAAGLLNTKPK